NARISCPLYVDHLSADGEERVQRRHWVLEDHGHLGAAQSSAPSLRLNRELFTLEREGGRRLRGIAGQQIHEREPQGPFAPPAFAHDADDGILGYLDVDSTKNVSRAAFRSILHVESANPDQRGRVHRGCLSLGSITSRRASPSKVKPSVANINANPE